jgi:hypothetical protein
VVMVGLFIIAMLKYGEGTSERKHQEKENRESRTDPTRPRDTVHNEQGADFSFRKEQLLNVKSIWHDKLMQMLQPIVACASRYLRGLR